VSNKYLGRQVEIHSTHDKPMKGILVSIDPLVALKREEDGKAVLIPMSQIRHIIVTEIKEEKKRKK